LTTVASANWTAIPAARAKIGIEDGSGSLDLVVQGSKLAVSLKSKGLIVDYGLHLIRAMANDRLISNLDLRHYI